MKGPRSTLGPARGPFPWGLLGALLLILAVERLVDEHSLWFTRPECWDWRTSHQSARRKARDSQVLCFGTSVTQQGLLPRVIGERSGRRAYNLAVCWGQAAGHYYLLKQALASGARPSAVVVEFHPQCLSGGLDQAMRFWPEALRSGDLLDLAWTARDGEFLGTTLLAHWVPSVRDRFTLRANVLGAFRGEASDLIGQTLVYVRNKNQNRGSIINGKNASYAGTVAPAFEQGLAPDAWSCDPINAVYLRRLFGLARRRGIAVYWLMPPYSPALQARREAKGLDATYSRFARGFQAEFPNLYVLDARHSHYPHTAFTDAAHLDRDGACTLSADVADAIRGSGPRWVELPRFGPRDTAVAIEDLAQSARARAGTKAGAGGGRKRR